MSYSTILYYIIRQRWAHRRRRRRRGRMARRPAAAPCLSSFWLWPRILPGHPPGSLSPLSTPPAPLSPSPPSLFCLLVCSPHPTKCSVRRPLKSALLGLGALCRPCRCLWRRGLGVRPRALPWARASPVAAELQGGSEGHPLRLSHLFDPDERSRALAAGIQHYL